MSTLQETEERIANLNKELDQLEDPGSDNSSVYSPQKQTTKDSVNRKGLHPKALEVLSKLNNKSNVDGVGLEPISEPIPLRLTLSGEKVYSNNNSFIVLGRDRPASRLSGYGGKGHTGASSLDLVVGMMAPTPKQVNDKGERIYADPNFKVDAARIYLSQKTDVDANFSIVAGSTGMSTTRSAIAIKADAVRIIGRENIKLITRTDVLNSQGGEIKSIGGIDLIANNDDSDLQPMVKGDNLSEALQQLTEHVDKLNGILNGFVMYQMKFNQAVTHHYHYSPFMALPTTPSISVVTEGINSLVKTLTSTVKSLYLHKQNLVSYKHNYFSPSGAKYIQSRYHNLN